MKYENSDETSSSYDVQYKNVAPENFQQEPLTVEDNLPAGKNRRLILLILLTLGVFIILSILYLIYYNKDVGSQNLQIDEVNDINTSSGIESESTVSYRAVSDDDFFTYHLPGQEKTLVSAFSKINGKAGLKLQDRSLVYED